VRQAEGAVASKKTKRAIMAADVPCVFDDARIERLAEIARLPKNADWQRFADSVKEAARIYAEDARKSNVNVVHDEIERLHQAAMRVLQLRKPVADDYEEVAGLAEKLSPEARQRFETRKATPGFERAKPGWLKFPSPADLRDPARRDEACDVVRQFCSMGGKYIEGRKRPSGKRSTTWAPLLHASERVSHPAKRETERQFVIQLQIGWLEATGELPALTANPGHLGPFARMVRECLRLAGAGYEEADKHPKSADPAVADLINEANKRRRIMLGPLTDEEKQLMRWEDDGGRCVVFVDAVVNPYVVEEIIIGVSSTNP
jgi:hypothetical protein